MRSLPKNIPHSALFVIIIVAACSAGKEAEPKFSYDPMLLRAQAFKPGVRVGSRYIEIDIKLLGDSRHGLLKEVLQKVSVNMLRVKDDS